MLHKFFEFVQSDFEPIKSFYLKDTLNTDIWDGFKMKEDIRMQLLTIAQDFYNSTDLKAPIRDVILTGSLANYNWSEKYSDFDLHILINFKDVNEDFELVKMYVNAAKNLWNKEHNIEIQNYEVEVYIQDFYEVHRSSGVYSLLKDKWNVKPVKTDFEIDEEDIRTKAEFIMDKIDSIDLNQDYESFLEEIKSIWDKIKRYRKSGLESEGGEFSTGNLIFKLLRRNGYIGKLLEIKKELYDKQFS